MHKRLILTALFAIVSGCGLEPVHPAVETRTYRIMPAGDSITCGTDEHGGYRGPLFAALGGRAVSVGPRDSATVCGGPGHHAGYPASHTSGYSGYLPGYLKDIRPDIVLLMLGTNGDNGGPEYVRDLVRPSLDTSDAILVVGAIPDGPSQGAYPETFNASLAAALMQVPEFGERLFYAPQTEFIPADGFSEDGLHPNTAGYERLAEAWRSALARIF
jgi:lysophospholipase L1-like esterase